MQDPEWPCRVGPWGSESTQQAGGSAQLGAQRLWRPCDLAAEGLAEQQRTPVPRGCQRAEKCSPEECTAGACCQRCQAGCSFACGSVQRLCKACSSAGTLAAPVSTCLLDQFLDNERGVVSCRRFADKVAQSALVDAGTSGRCKGDCRAVRVACAHSSRHIGWCKAQTHSMQVRFVPAQGGCWRAAQALVDHLLGGCHPAPWPALCRLAHGCSQQGETSLLQNRRWG